MAVTNLRNMRRFYQAFPIRDALRTELSWTHYRSLLRIDNPSAQEWYLHEAISQNWIKIGKSASSITSAYWPAKIKPW